MSVAVYPVVGMLPGDEPDHIEIGRYGVRYDHEVAIMDR